MSPSGRADYFQMQKVIDICISVQNETDVFVSYLSVNYFQFRFPFFVSLYSVAECELN